MMWITEWETPGAADEFTAFTSANYEDVTAIDRQGSRVFIDWNPPEGNVKRIMAAE